MSRPSDRADVLGAQIMGFAVDVHDLSLLVPLRQAPEVGQPIALEVRGRDGLRLRVLGKVAGAPDEAGGGTPIRVLDVRPRHEQPLITMESLRPPSLPPGLAERSLRVLVVDDDETLRRRASGAMRAAGYEVAEAVNGADALSQASGQPFDLVLTDVNMPTMDGWQLLRLIRAREDLRHLPVIFLTTLSNERERMRGYAQGVDDYVDKPFEMQDLTERVERLLQRGRGAPNRTAGERSLHGDLARVSLGSLLSFLEGDRHTGLLRLHHRGMKAEVAVRDGFVRSVALRPDPCEGEDQDLQRLFHMLDWTEGEFELLRREVDGEDELGLPTAYILLEHARRKDETT